MSTFKRRCDERVHRTNAFLHERCGVVLTVTLMHSPPADRCPICGDKRPTWVLLESAPPLTDDDPGSRA